MLHRIPVKRVSLYKIESEHYEDMVTDLNYIIEDLEANGDDGVFPITFSRISNEGDTYTEIHTDLIYVLRWGGLVGMLEYPVGTTVELDDKYEATAVKSRAAYILPRISESKLEYVDQVCTSKGHMLSAHSINNPAYVQRMQEWIELEASSLDISPGLPVLKAAADYREHVLEGKFDEVVDMTGGEGLEGLSENPYEDVFYAHEQDAEPYIDREVDEGEWPKIPKISLRD